MTSEQIEQIWQEIEAEGRSEQGWHIRRLPGAGNHDLKVGRRVPSGSVGLLYEIESSIIPADTEWPEGKGFSTDIETLEPGPSGKIRLMLELSNTQYRDVFAVLCSDVTGVIIDEEDERRGVRAFIQRLHAWQKFMQFHSRTGLSKEQIRGLYAELRVLELMLMENAGTSAIEMWQGRQGLHDFRYGDRSLEIKSSLTKFDPVVSISRLDQLDETLVEALHMCFVPLSEDHEHGESVPDAVSRLRGLLGPYPARLQRLEDLLIAYGYHDIQASLYSEQRLLSGEPQLYEVSEGFPRLRVDELSDGIVSGNYRINLSSCNDHLVDEESFLEAFLGVEDSGK